MAEAKKHLPRKRAYEGDERNLLGPKFREFREAAGLSQSQLAAKLQRGGWDISKATLSAVELQKRTLTDMEVAKLLKILGKDWSDLKP